MTLIIYPRMKIMKKSGVWMIKYYLFPDLIKHASKTYILIEDERD